MADKLDNFKNIAPNLFKTLVNNYNYNLDEIKVSDLSVKLIYTNNEKKLRIEIEQAPYRVDYGFSFFIYKIGTEDYDLLLNIPHEKQDLQNVFLIEAYHSIFTNEESLNIIRGKFWKGKTWY